VWHRAEKFINLAYTDIQAGHHIVAITHHTTILALRALLEARPVRYDGCNGATVNPFQGRTVDCLFFNSPVQNGDFTFAGKPGKAVGIRIAEALNHLLDTQPVPHLWNTVRLDEDLRYRRYAATRPEAASRQGFEAAAITAKYGAGPQPATGTITDADPLVAQLAVEMLECRLSAGILKISSERVPVCARAGSPDPVPHPRSWHHSGSSGTTRPGPGPSSRPSHHRARRDPSPSGQSRRDGHHGERRRHHRRVRATLHRLSRATTVVRPALTRSLRANRRSARDVPPRLRDPNDVRDVVSAAVRSEGKERHSGRSAPGAAQVLSQSNPGQAGEIS
jgi:hypothetical protein